MVNEQEVCPATMTVSRQSKYEDLPELLSVDEACSYTGLGRSTLYELCRTMKVPHLKFGRIIRICKAAFAPLNGDKRHDSR